ncbi:MAG: hypothetical protein ACI8QD_001522 [Cyclobacteriaceae bacterium]|jgi:hypothetical protein
MLANINVTRSVRVIFHFHCFYSLTICFSVVYLIIPVYNLAGRIGYKHHLAKC